MGILPTFKNPCDGILPFVNIVLTDKCPHNCIYCIAAKSKNKYKINNEITIKELAGKIIEIGYPCAVIEGGEPLLYPEKVNELIDYLKGKIKIISMFTSLPENINTPENKILFKQIINKLSRCTISMASSDPEIASKIMQKKPQYWRNEFLKELSDEGYNYRVSILLCKNYIDTDIKVKNEIITFFNLGAKELKIGEIANDKTNFISFKDIFSDIELGDPLYDGCNILITKKLLPKVLKDIELKNRQLFFKRICFLTTKGKYGYKLMPKEKLKLALRNYKGYFLSKLRVSEKPFFKVIYADGEIKNNWK